MKNPDRVVTWCLLLVASSFWLYLAWAYFTDQSKDSFYVGPAVVGVGITFAIDLVLFLFAIACAVKGLVKKEVHLRMS